MGGLGSNIRALKEMIIFPLTYPEVFEKFHIQPPRGVLFYGPPGSSLMSNGASSNVVRRLKAGTVCTTDRKISVNALERRT